MFNGNGDNDDIFNGDVLNDGLMMMIFDNDGAVYPYQMFDDDVYVERRFHQLK